MMVGTGRKFVVDADISRAAADPARAERRESIQPYGLMIGEWLDAMKAARHVVVFTPELWGEWQQHQSTAAIKWLARMTERRLVLHITAPILPNDWIDELILSHLPDHDQPVANKDRHLVLTSCLCADLRLLSADYRAREKFERLADHDSRLKILHWVGPKQIEVRSWLLGRAPDRAEWQLGWRG